MRTSLNWAGAKHRHSGVWLEGLWYRIYASCNNTGVIQTQTTWAISLDLLWRCQNIKLQKIENYYSSSLDQQAPWRYWRKGCYCWMPLRALGYYTATADQYSTLDSCKKFTFTKNDPGKLEPWLHSLLSLQEPSRDQKTKKNIHVVHIV